MHHRLELRRVQLACQRLARKRLVAGGWAPSAPRAGRAAVRVSAPASIGATLSDRPATCAASSARAARAEPGGFAAAGRLWRARLSSHRQGRSRSERSRSMGGNAARANCVAPALPGWPAGQGRRSTLGGGSIGEAQVRSRRLGNGRRGNRRAHGRTRRLGSGRRGNRRAQTSRRTPQGSRGHGENACTGRTWRHKGRRLDDRCPRRQMSLCGAGASFDRSCASNGDCVIALEWLLHEIRRHPRERAGPLQHLRARCGTLRPVIPSCEAAT